MNAEARHDSRHRYGLVGRFGHT